MTLTLENMTVIGSELALKWSDGVESYLPMEFLRKHCPCAVCAGETDLLGQVFKGETVFTARSFQLQRCVQVGGYAIQPEWGDGHHSGIYSYSYLRSLTPDLS
jgi:DUF971 family protein